MAVTLKLTEDEKNDLLWALGRAQMQTSKMTSTYPSSLRFAEIARKVIALPYEEENTIRKPNDFL